MLPALTHASALSTGCGEDTQLIYHLVTVRCPVMLPFQTLTGRVLTPVPRACVPRLRAMSLVELSASTLTVCCPLPGRVLLCPSGLPDSCELALPGWCPHPSDPMLALEFCIRWTLLVTQAQSACPLSSPSADRNIWRTNVLSTEHVPIAFLSSLPEP